MSIHSEHPGDVAWNVELKLAKRIRKLAHFDKARFVDLGRPLLEQYFRLEHEAIADHQDTGTVTQDLSQPPEELRAVARQLLDALGERRVEPFAKIDDLRLACDIALLGIGKEGRKLTDLTPERPNLLVQELNLGERISGDLFLLVERRPEAADRGAGFGALRGFALEHRRKLCSLAFFAREIIAQCGETRRKLRLRGLFHCQELAQFGDLRAQLAECRVLAGDLAGQQELRDDEHRQEEGDDEQKLRHRVDKAWPIGSIADATAAGKRDGHELFLVLDY